MIIKKQMKTLIKKLLTSKYGKILVALIVKQVTDLIFQMLIDKLVTSDTPVSRSTIVIEFLQSVRAEISDSIEKSYTVKYD